MAESIEENHTLVQGANATSEDDGENTLASIFQEGLNLFNNLGRIDEPTNSSSVQVNEN